MGPVLPHTLALPKTKSSTHIDKINKSQGSYCERTAPMEQVQFPTRDAFSE